MTPGQTITARQFDRLAAETLTDRLYPEFPRDPFTDLEEDELPPARYAALQACMGAESEAAIVDAWYARCMSGPADHGEDLGLAAKKQGLAQVAWLHYGYARDASAEAKGDPEFGPRAAAAAARALRAARAISRGAAQAVAFALRARAAARPRVGAPGRLRSAHKTVRHTPRRRAPARRVRLSAVASAGSGTGDPSPEPSPEPLDPRLPKGSA
jgi:hypothetical protein